MCGECHAQACKGIGGSARPATGDRVSALSWAALPQLLWSGLWGRRWCAFAALH